MNLSKNYISIPDDNEHISDLEVQKTLFFC